MGAGYSVDYLRAEALIAVIRAEDQRDVAHPLLRLFPRRQHRGGKIKVRKLKRKIGRIVHTSFGGRARPVRRGAWSEILYEPSAYKLFDILTADDLILFADAARAKGANDVSPMAQSTISAANDRIRELGVILRGDTSEERHALCAGALQGTATYQIEGGPGGLETVSVDYGLTSLTAPSTDWDDAGATIVNDITGWITEFKDNNDLGLPPNLVVYNPAMWAECLLGNTEFQTWRKQDPELARGFLRLAGGVIEADTEGMFTQDFFGLNWLPVEGTYRDVADDSNDNRWAADKLVFCRVGGMEQGMDSHWAMVFDPLQNPQAEMNVEISEPKVGDDVKAVKVTSFDNGLPVFGDPQFVQPVDVVA